MIQALLDNLASRGPWAAVALTLGLTVINTSARVYAMRVALNGTEAKDRAAILRELDNHFRWWPRRRR